ncbi:MAG: radical SAM family heme chaperone HemW [Clostridia bacterium]|nr:radical SAM family heme chaperone HemW [Clostridia bacterium]
MELYIHIPFCLQKCRYCDFASYAGRASLMQPYVDAVLTEARIEAEHLGHPTIETIFLGGGTPSLLPPEELVRLMDGIHYCFPIAQDAEITSEANPGTLTEDWLRSAVDAGINRLSLGMQAAQPRLLRLLGRIHTLPEVVQSADMARQAGIRNLNLDLMFGLPTQNVEDWQETLHAAFAMEPEHLSCYGLIPEDGTPLKRDLDAGRLSLPEEDAERTMYDLTLNLLAAQGYEQYEISNFAKAGFACKHNLGYWRQVPYLGLGASAASMIPDADASNAYLRRSNPASLEQYLSMIKERDFSVREETPISKKEAQFETLMLGLRTTKGVSESAYTAMHGVSMDQRYGATLARLEKQGLLLHQAGYWRLSRRGMDVQNAVLVELMDD